MKFDYIIIGGGLCGLTAGIQLASQGKKTAVVSSGQSALHFNSGSFGLLGDVNEKVVTNPIEAIASLPSEHPYSKIGAPSVEKLATEAKTLLNNAGITTSGDATANHYTLSAFGVSMPTWLTMECYPEMTEKTPSFKKVLAIAFKGFLEAYPTFIAENLSKEGIAVRVETIDLECIAKLRKSNFDMRTITVAKHFNDEAVEELASKINALAQDGETVLIPAIVGFKSAAQISKLKELVKVPFNFIPTIPVSLAGVRSQNLLEKYFEQVGGTFLLGDKIEKGVIENGKVKYLVSTNLGEDHLEADTYILAAGSLFGEGIQSNPKGFYEPIFGLDVKSPENRDEWYDENFFAPQPYMAFGVNTDADLHPTKDGKAIENLYAAGSILAGCNSLAENSGAGVAMITALYVASK